MDQERWERVRSIFDRALALAALEREAFIRGECGGDQSLVDEVLELLRNAGTREFNSLAGFDAAAAVLGGVTGSAPLRAVVVHRTGAQATDFLRPLRKRPQRQGSSRPATCAAPAADRLAYRLVCSRCELEKLADR